ncbi:hypothetical protein ACFQZC_10810 [Streptacidiphilus monticola]
MFASRTVIRFGCSTPGAGTFLDVKPRTLHGIVLNGRALDPAALSDGRYPLTSLAADNELVVEADMAYSHTGEGMHRYTDPADGEAYVYTQSFLDDGPRVFAAFDQPDLKAPYQLTVNAPAGWTVVGNGEAVSRPAEGRPVAGRSRPPSRSAATWSASSPARCTACSPSTTASPSACTAAARWPRTWTPTPRRSWRPPGAASTTTTGSSGSGTPSAATTSASSRSSTPARWRTPAA